MANTHLANIHEITFALYCINDKLQFDSKSITVTEPPGASKEMKDLLKALSTSVGKVTDKTKALTKFIQAKNSVQDLKVYLGKKGSKCPPSWGDTTFWDDKLKIVDSGWTNTSARFTKIVGDFLTQCSAGSTTVSHENNPSDVVILVENTKGDKKPLGISLKATFSTSDIGIYNGGMCSFLAIISGKNDLAKKDEKCPRKPIEPFKTLESDIKQPYADFLKACKKAPLNFGSKLADNKKQWKKVVGEKKDIKNKKLWNDKLMALSMMRDNLYDQLVEDWGLRKKTNGSHEVTMSDKDLNKIIGGIFQFTHSSITAGGCNVPYFKLTSLLNLKLKPNTKEADINNSTMTSIAPPNLSKYVKTGANTLTIKKVADVSILLGTNGNDYFTIRVKLESVPPSGIKIDICPYNNKKSGGARSTRPVTLFEPSGTVISTSKSLASNLDNYNKLISELPQLSDEEYTILNNMWDETFCEPNEKEQDEDQDEPDTDAFCEKIDKSLSEIKRELVKSIEQEIECISGDKDLAKRVGRAGPQTRALTALTEKVGHLGTLLGILRGKTRLHGKKTQRRRKGSRRKGKGSRKNRK